LHRVHDRSASGRYAVAADALDGSIDLFRVEPQGIRLAGWAGKVEAGAAVDEILVFQGPRCILRTMPHTARADVADCFKKPGLLQSGFHVILAFDRSSAADIRVFGRRKEIVAELRRPPVIVAETQIRK
jgi:hypothetical protein